MIPKANGVLILAACLTLGLMFTKSAGNAHEGPAEPLHTNYKNAGNGFAVVELFTSEGCSSCPPADELVEKVEKEYRDKPVFLLAFHVDYWDRGGWKDRFSDHLYSARQRQYASWLKAESVYTPQIVVNGTQEFIGSQEGTLHNALAVNLRKAALSKLTLAKTNAGKEQLNFDISADTSVPNTDLVFAVLEKSATTVVKGGENEGHTLSHVQIVRGLKVLPFPSGKTLKVSIANPPGLATNDLEVIAFLQNRSNGEIIAATKG